MHQHVGPATAVLPPNSLDNLGCKCSEILEVEVTGTWLTVWIFFTWLFGSHSCVCLPFIWKGPDTGRGSECLYAHSTCAWCPWIRLSCLPCCELCFVPSPQSANSFQSPFSPPHSSTSSPSSMVSADFEPGEKEEGPASPWKLTGDSAGLP